MTLKLSNSAENKLRELLDEKQKPDQGLRVYVQGGGCAGMSYGMEFDDNVRDFDEVIEQNGLRIIVDKFSMKYIQGSEIEYTDEGLMGGSFSVNNPKAKTTCGCGHSFKA